MERTTYQVIPIFNGDKYDFWRIKMTTILKTRKLWTVVENGVPNRPTQTEETPEVLRLKNNWEKATTQDMMALQILQTAVSDQIFSRIAPATTSKEAWDALQSEYQGSPQVRLIKLQSLRREYENLKMNESENIKVFTGKLIDLGNQLRVHGEEKTDYQIVQKILISLPARFDSIMAVMEQTKDLTSLPVTELIGTLKAHKKRVSSRNESMNEGVFYVLSREGKTVVKPENGKSKWLDNKGKKLCGFCNKENHTESNCWKKKTELINDSKRCYKCGQVGHLVRECRSKKDEWAHMGLENEDEEEHMLFSACKEASSSNVNDETWFQDSTYQGLKN